MPLNLTKEQETFPNQYTKGEFSFVYSSGDVKLFLQADSKNKIFRYNYEASDKSLGIYEVLSPFLLDQNLDELLQNFSSKVSVYFKSNENLDQAEVFELDIASLHIKEALLEYSGERRNLFRVEADKVICRCSKIDNKGFQEIFLKHKGDKKLIQTESNISLICGSCSNLFLKKYSEESCRHEIYDGKSYEEWSGVINAALTEFGMFSPADFSGASIEVTKLSLPSIVLNIKSDNKDFDTLNAKKTLMNFLAAELKIPLELSVLLNNASSN